MSEIDSLVATLKAELVAKLEAAYAKGFAAGAEDMRARILSVAQGPIAPTGEVAATPVPPPRPPMPRLFDTPIPPPRPLDRAPRGAVTHMLDRVLTDRPGLTIVEIEMVAGEYDPSVAAKSIGNSLRRYEGSRYKRNERSQWFLIGSDVETETTAGDDPAVDVFS